MIWLAPALALLKTFTGGFSAKTWLILGSVVLVAIVLITAVMIHQRAVHNALQQAGQAAALGERLEWQEQQRRADIAREQERRSAQARIDVLENEAASQRGRIESQEAELEQAIKSSENAPKDPSTNSPSHVLPRDLVRTLDRQGR